MVDIIPGYDRKKGKYHNFETVARYLTLVDKKYNFETGWLIFWCDMLLFDAIIGNTDRHQDNWGLLWNQDQGHRVRLSPVFDNGTSLGYEILESKMNNFYMSNKMSAYIRRGKHHIRWQLNDDHQCQHVELRLRLLKKYPELNDHIKNKLDLFKIDQLRAIIETCLQYPVTVPLTQKRAKFICHLVKSRYLNINEQIKFGEFNS